MSRGLVFCQRPRPMDRQAMRERKKESFLIQKKEERQSIVSAIDRVLGCCNPNQLVFSTGAKNYSDEKF